MGVSSTFFGFLFGEFLGDIGLRFGLHAVTPWLHRETAIVGFLLMSLGIGVLHISLGFVLKMYIGVVSKHLKSTYEALAKIVFITGMVLVFTQLLLGFPVVVQHIGLAVIAAGLLGIFATEGFVGLLEVFSLLGNILSYSRIMAIGLSSVILAVVANRLAEASENIVVAIVIGLIIHSINFVMGIFSPTIHSLRLHYVEFFGKFFKATGKPFQPFKKIREDLT